MFKFFFFFSLNIFLCWIRLSSPKSISGFMTTGTYLHHLDLFFSITLNQRTRAHYLDSSCYLDDFRLATRLGLSHQWLVMSLGLEAVDLKTFDILVIWKERMKVQTVCASGSWQHSQLIKTKQNEMTFSQTNKSQDELHLGAKTNG